MKPNAKSRRPARKRQRGATSKSAPLPTTQEPGKDTPQTVPNPTVKTQEGLTETVERLSKLSPGDYETCRKAEAARLKIRVTALDEQVKAKKFNQTQGSVPELRASVPNPEPWPQTVNGAELLAELKATLCRTMYLPPHADVVLAVWVLHTYLFDCFEYTPYLHISSPVKECGKTTLAKLLYRLCYKATRPGGMSAAAMLRRIEDIRPTLLVDEWDTLSDETKKAAVNTLNTGFEYDGVFTMCEGEQHVTKDFHTFCPKAIFGLEMAKLPETTRSRCIQVRLHRKPNDVALERLTKVFSGEELRRKCLRWAADNRVAMQQDATPNFPPNFGSRQQDISAPLLRIADACGGEWPRVLRGALVHFFQAVATDEPSLEIELLADVRQLFDDRKTDRFGTAEICDWLNGRHDSPLDGSRRERQWSAWNHGNGITQRQLATRLRIFGICPRNIRFADGKVVKGFLFEDCKEAFGNYLSPPGDSSRYTATKAENIGDSSPSQPLPPAAGSGSQIAQNPNKDAAGSGVADKKPEPGQ